ncbi:hypothetical protein M670_01414 [Schinkia azotoformans MEV2011]|uniref:Uncharacterized protein n=1 Tax=Schinkia azotoformans MEV2011 TaxID=1348973 RepID=A0A072NQ58_SCHAZ|nr:hypothetical protein M670_01414 [Schinkia azotoformans MEV2011]
MGDKTIRVILIYLLFNVLLIPIYRLIFIAIVMMEFIEPNTLMGYFVVYLITITPNLLLFTLLYLLGEKLKIDKKLNNLIFLITSIFIFIFVFYIKFL